MSSTDAANPDVETPIEAMSYEQAFTALEAALAAIELERQPLEEAMQLYERGQVLIRRCMALLEQAELKVRQLSGGELTDLTAQE